MEGNFEDLLITEVEKRQFLYDHRDAKHSDSGRVQNGWNAVATALTECGFSRASGPICKAEFAKLREKFRVERKERKRETGSAARKRRYVFFFRSCGWF